MFDEFFNIRKKKTKILLLALSGLLLTGMILKTAAYSILMMKKDVRIIAAEYIDKNIPWRSEIIFTSDPWIFEVPPVNQTRYGISMVPEDGLANVHSGSYLIIGELQYFLTSGNRKKQMNEKVQELQNKGFVLKYCFETCPGINGLKFDQGWTIHDMIYTHPKILVFHKQ